MGKKSSSWDSLVKLQEASNIRWSVVKSCMTFSGGLNLKRGRVRRNPESLQIQQRERREPAYWLRSGAAVVGIWVKMGRRCYVFRMSSEQFDQPLFPPAIRLFPPNQDWSKAVLAAFRSSFMVLVLIRASFSSPFINQRQPVWPKMRKRFCGPQHTEDWKGGGLCPSFSSLQASPLLIKTQKNPVPSPLSDLGRKEKHLWCKSSGWGFILYQGGVHMCYGKFSKIQ